MEEILLDIKKELTEIKEILLSKPEAKEMIIEGTEFFRLSEMMRRSE